MTFLKISFLKNMNNKNNLKNRVKILIFLLLLGNFFVSANSDPPKAPELFSFTELKELYEIEKLSESLETKLRLLLTQPFVNNSFQGELPLRLKRSERLGEFLRVAHWNIERGLEFDAIQAVFESEEKLLAVLDNERFPPGSDKRRKLLEQAALLRESDVIVLNEVDLGIKRTGYRNVAADLAEKLKMNYAFGVQFVELSPIFINQKVAPENKGETAILNLINVDTTLYKGLQGIAILSRFPLENVRLVPFETQPYDWYKSEKKGVSLLEKGKREISKRIFLEKILPEVRRGGRSALIAEIADSRLPSGRVSIVATHLENRTIPANRNKQLKELLEQIKEIRHPVIMAGDMNTSTSDLTPTSFRRELTKRFGNPKFWIKQGITMLLGIGFLEDFAWTAVSFGRTHANPTVKNIPIISPNPERQFFSTLENFRFSDGNAFDFRGDPARSHGNKGKKLSASNERARTGFVTTYQVERPIGFIGKYKLDWIFVKPANLTKPEDCNQSYLFAPHFGRTLTEINEVVEDRISDHRPILVDLPISEPPLIK
jgi:endonuclease/exonuclease/phosphatase family metal-dependent hydrolase